MQGRTPADARYRAARTRSLAWIAAMIVSTAGCQGMAMTQESGNGKASKIDNTVADWPLTFVQHNFGAHCFDTIGCKITYSGFTHGVDGDDEVSPPLASYRGTREQILSAGHIARRNFPPSAHVTWRSKDGAAHEADVDIAGIFRDRKIVHQVPREEIREGVSITDPDIVLEVEDRTITVYMRAFIPTKALQIAGNPYSGHRNDLVRVWSRTY